MKRLYIILGLAVALAVFVYVYTDARRRDLARQRLYTKRTLQRVREMVEREKHQRDAHAAALYTSSLETLRHTIRDPSSSADDALFRAARFVSRGVYPVLNPDPWLAATCCRAIVHHSKDTRAVRDARFLLYSLHIPDDDTAPTAATYDDAIVHDIDARIAEIQSTRHTRIAPREMEIVEPVDDDRQNSHDSGVARSVREILDSLPNASFSRDDIERYISICSLDDETKAKALYALDTVSSDIFSTMSETDALARVWHASCDKDTVILQLASSIENGLPVCHSGKLARFASVMDTGESKHSIVPVWVLRRHAAGIASTTRQRILETASPADRAMYDTHGHEHLTQQMIDMFTSRMEPHMERVPDHMKRLIIDEYTTAF